MDMDSAIYRTLRSGFGEEADAGFPRLRRIPQSRIIQFLDYFVALAPDDQSTLLDALALRASVLFDLRSGTTFPPAPAFDRYWKAITTQGPFTGGYRYCDIKFLASIPNVPEFGGYERWIEMYQKPWVSQLAMTPREDLLPSLACLKPAKTSMLRKLVRSALKTCGFAPEVTKGAEQKYVSSSGDTVRVDFGSRVGQICYGVSAARGDIRMIKMSFESLWSQPGGWDYLTEENAARAVEFLPDFVQYLIGLTNRIAGRAST